MDPSDIIPSIEEVRWCGINIAAAASRKATSFLFSTIMAIKSKEFLLEKLAEALSGEPLADSLRSLSKIRSRSMISEGNNGGWISLGYMTGCMALVGTTGTKADDSRWDAVRREPVVIWRWYGRGGESKLPLGFRPLDEGLWALSAELARN